MPHGMHPIPATAMSAVEGLLAIVPGTFLVGFQPSSPSYFLPTFESTALSRRRPAIRLLFSPVDRAGQNR